MIRKTISRASKTISRASKYSSGSHGFLPTVTASQRPVQQRVADEKLTAYCRGTPYIKTENFDKYKVLAAGKFISTLKSRYSAFSRVEKYYTICRHYLPLVLQRNSHFEYNMLQYMESMQTLPIGSIWWQTKWTVLFANGLFTISDLTIDTNVKWMNRVTASNSY